MKFAVLLLAGGLLVKGGTDSPQATFDRAVQALSAGDYSTAEQEFRTVLRQQPNNVGAIGNLGILYARMDRIDKAIGQYQSALRLSPDNEPILLDLGLVYLKEELHGRALPYFTRVLQLDPGNRQARQLVDVCRLYTGQITPAIHDLEDLRLSDGHDEQLLFLLGFAYMKNGDVKTAHNLFNQMFEVAGPTRVQFLLGRASYEAALFPQAEQSFLEVRRLNADFPDIHLELGKVYISERRTDEAVHELKQALQENPSNEDANYFLGSLLVRESRYDEGIPYLETARKLKPDSYGVDLYLGRAKLHLGKSAEAVILLKQAAELNPDDANVQYALGRALKSNGQDAAAAQAFERARSLKAGALSEATIPGLR